MTIAMVAAIGLSCATNKVKSAWPPSALAGARRVTISFNYSRFRVAGMGEAEFVQRQTASDGPDFPTRWWNLKASYESAFIEGFNHEWPGGSVAAPPGSAGVGLVVVPDSLELGRFTEPTVMLATMGWIVRGRAVEEIQLVEESRKSMLGGRFAQQAGRIGRTMGEKAARYLSSRQ